MQKLKRHWLLGCLISASLVGGCSRGLPFQSDPYTSTPYRDTVITNRSDLTDIDQLTAHGLLNTSSDPERNNFISLKMYLIDKNYFEYERQLTNEDVTFNTLGSIGTLATTAVASAIPAGQATKVLAAVATGLNGATSIYDQKALLTKTIQSLQIEMRADRDIQAAQIYSRMHCSFKVYNIGMALSDLEAYARAGTFEAALQGLSKTVSQAQTTASDTKKAAISGALPSNNLANQAQSLADKIQTTATCPLV